MNEQKQSKERQRRTVVRQLRLTADEAQKWDAAALEVGMTVSNWMRQRIGDVKQSTVQPKAEPDQNKLIWVRKADPELVRQVARVGNNLNQVARAVNQCVMAGDPIQTIELVAVLVGIQSDIKALLDIKERVNAYKISEAR